MLHVIVGFAVDGPVVECSDLAPGEAQVSVHIRGAEKPRASPERPEAGTDCNLYRSSCSANTKER